MIQAGLCVICGSDPRLTTYAHTMRFNTPNFLQDSQDSQSVAPAQALPLPELDSDSSDSSVDITSLKQCRPIYKANPTFAPSTAAPRPLLLPAFPITNNHIIPPSAPPMPQSLSTHSSSSPAAMPPPCSHRAPYFSGQVGDPIEDFLREYEEHAGGIAAGLELECVDN